MLAFERPWALSLLILVPALAFLGRMLRARGLAAAFPHAGIGAGRPLRAPLLRRALRLGRELALWLSVAACVVSLSGPALVNRRVLYLGRGNEVIFVLDVSPSMAASDFAPSRLDAAKAIIGEFIAARRNETVGLVAFGGEAALICPPTADYRILAERLATIVPGLYGEGTAIGAGIAVAVAHTARSSAPERHVVVLTDGENNAGAIDPGTAAAAAVRFGIELSVIGVGSAGDVPIAYVDPITGQKREGGYRSDFDRGALERLARTGRGQYFAAEDKAALAAAFSAISERSASLTRTRTISAEESLAARFLVIALAAFAACRLLGMAGGGGRA